MHFQIFFSTFASKYDTVMCLNPIIRPNPNYGRRRIGLMFMKDCENKHIYVPCGHCPDCIAMRQAQIVQRCDAESRENHVFFCTLTYDNKHIPESPLRKDENGTLLGRNQPRAGGSPKTDERKQVTY